MSFLLASTSGDNSTLAGDALEEDAACDTPSHSINSIGELFRVVSTEGYAALLINTSVDPFNPTGESTKAYIVAVELATKLTEQHRLFSTKRNSNHSKDYCFQPTKFASSALRSVVTAKLNSLRGNSDVYRNAKEFQRKMTTAWCGDPDPARILHGKISVLDETTKQGASALLIQFMVQARLIERDEPTRRFRLCPNWKQQTLVVIGDGLSLDIIVDIANKHCFQN